MSPTGGSPSSALPEKAKLSCGLAAAAGLSHWLRGSTNCRRKSCQTSTALRPWLSAWPGVSRADGTRLAIGGEPSGILRLGVPNDYQRPRIDRMMNQKCILPAMTLLTVSGVIAALLASACARNTDTVRPKGTDESLAPLGREIAWLGDLHQPEGVKYDPEQDVFFISNMVGYGSDHDKNGYIVEVSAGNLANSKVFAENGKAGVVLDAPKGMTLHGDTLWVADIDLLRGFNRKTGMPIGTIDLRPLGAVLLNDVTIGGDGAIYITDTGILMTDKGGIHTGPDRIFTVKDGKPSVFAEGSQLARPNGIVWDKEGKRL